MVVYVETRTCSTDKPVYGPKTDGNVNCIELTVRDDGPGFPEKILSQVFEPFTSTKGKGHSGLGLSIVQTLVTELKGSVTCKSSEEKGTLFTLIFPIKQ